MTRSNSRNAWLKRSLTMGTVLLLGVSLAACSSKGETAAVVDGGGVGTADDPVTITMIANQSFSQQWQEKLLPEFNKAYPNIKVEIEGVPYDELLTKSMLDLTATAPEYDIVIVDDPWTPQLAEVGGLLDLKSDAVTGWTDEDYDWDDFYAAPLAASEWDGVQYGVPLRSNLLNRFINTSLYEAAGVEVPDESQTWEEFLEEGEKLVRDTNGDGAADVWALSTMWTRGTLTPTVWQTILDSNGGSLFDEDMNPTFDDDLGAEALQMHKDLMQIAPPGAEAHNFDEPLAAFRGGTVANMFLWGSVYYGTAVDPATTTLTPDEVIVTTMPAGTDGPSSHRGIWSGSINKNSEHPEAAWALLQWMSSKEGEHWSVNNLGVFPARKSTVSSTPEAGNEWLVPVFEAIDAGFTAVEKQQGWRPRDPQSNAIQEILADVTSLAMTGELTAEEALDRGAEEVNDLLAK